MHLRWTIGTIVCAVLLTSLTPVQAFDDGKYPDFSGQWVAVRLGVRGQPAFDPLKGWGRLQEAPLNAEYKALHETSLADQAAGGQGLWMSGARCMPTGMPATMNVYNSMEIMVLPEITHVMTEHNIPVHRRIYTDGRGWPAEVEPSYQGHSIGQWIDQDGDGRYDVLEVETRYFKGPRTLDPTGIPTHADNQSVVKERIFADKAIADFIHDEVTLFDNAFTKPWTVFKTYRRSPDK
jgi:hypothetical protein